MQPASESPAVVGNFTLNAQLPNSVTLSLAGYVLATDSREEVQDRVTDMQAVIDLHRTRCEIPILEANLEMKVQHLADVKRVLQEFKDKADSRKLTSQERNNLENAERNIPRVLQEIEDGQAAIAKAKAKVGLTGND